METTNPSHNGNASSLARIWPFLASLLLLVACGTGPGTSTQVAPTEVITLTPMTTAETKATPESRATNEPSPNTAGQFDCANVKQVSPAECTALVALYNSSDGPAWADNSGWLESDTLCTWYGITCTGDHVSHISLSYNQLTGSLPPALGSLSQVQVIDMRANRLRGPIPVDLGNLSELVSLYLGDNLFTGSLPAELGNLGKLRSLSLDRNQLRGSIPPALGKAKSLESLFLSYNQFSGAIPPQIGDLGNLYALYMSHNQLSGDIPATFGKLNKLSEVDLSYNQLQGPVPESVSLIDQSMLWGNQLEGTIAVSGQAPVAVGYSGIHFSADPSITTGIWPEVKPASPLPEVLDGPSYWLALPEHVRFTFANPDLPPDRRRMGINLAAEGQILVFPLAELAGMNPLVQSQIEALQKLLAEQRPLPSGEYPLLPLTNSAQVFTAQAQTLEFGNIQGLRYISQHSQDPHPIMLSQELFYTFQGMSNDGAYYVAAFFPLTTDALPDTIEVQDWEAFHANYDTYLSETTAILDRLPPAEFTPDLALLDAVVTSLRIEPGVAPTGEFAAY